MFPGASYPRLLQCFLVGRRLIPGSIRGHIRRFMFESLDMQWILPTGVRVCVGHYGDWVIYNEVFVSGEYDGALRRLVESEGGAPMHVVDLGANTGYFTLRTIDRLRAEAGGPANVTVTAVEANPDCVRTFRARVFDENGLVDSVRLLHGLVGRRSGHGTLQIDDTHVASSSIVAPDLSHGRRIAVPYLDLSAVFASTPVIHLLKCDIEGAEELFIDAYPDVLAKVRIAVFEFHRGQCDVDRCLALLRTYGFAHLVIYRDSPQNFTCGVWR